MLQRAEKAPQRPLYHVLSTTGASKRALLQRFFCDVGTPGDGLRVHLCLFTALTLGGPLDRTHANAFSLAAKVKGVKNIAVLSHFVFFIFIF